MKTIGLIGGLSWESSAVYYRLINELVRDRLAPGLPTGALDAAVAAYKKPADARGPEEVKLVYDLLSRDGRRCDGTQRCQHQGAQNDECSATLHGVLLSHIGRAYASTSLCIKEKHSAGPDRRAEPEHHLNIHHAGDC